MMRYFKSTHKYYHELKAIEKAIMSLKCHPHIVGQVQSIGLLCTCILDTIPK